MRLILICAAPPRARRLPQAGPAGRQSKPAPAAEAGPHKGVDRSHKGKPAPDAKFNDAGRRRDGDDSPTSGKPMLVNLWATWCAPCVKELPTLDELREQATAAHTSLAVSQDNGPHASVVAFLQSTRSDAASLSGPEDGLSGALGPERCCRPRSSIDAQGKEVWRYVGDLDWTSPEAAKLLAEAGAAVENRLSSRPSIAARPSAISASPTKSCGARCLAEEQAAEQDRDRRHQQGDEQRIGRARRLDQPEIEHVAEGGAEQRERDDRAPGGERREGVGPRAGRRTSPSAASSARRRSAGRW